MVATEKKSEFYESLKIEFYLLIIIRHNFRVSLNRMIYLN